MHHFLPPSSTHHPSTPTPTTPTLPPHQPTLGCPSAAPPSWQNIFISSSLASASMNSTSAPASANALARASASSSDSAWRASVRATIRMSAPSLLFGGWRLGVGFCEGEGGEGLCGVVTARGVWGLAAATEQPVQSAGRRSRRAIACQSDRERIAHRASAAARMRDTASSRETTRLLRTWPQDLGQVWSSIKMPGACLGVAWRVGLRMTWLD